MTRTYRPDEVVDITIRGAIVDIDYAGELTISVCGVEMPFTIPLVTDGGDPLRQVTVTRADIISAAPAPVLDLSTLGQDYEPDPALRIAGIAAEFPEYVVRVDGGEVL